LAAWVGTAASGATASVQVAAAIEVHRQNDLVQRTLLGRLLHPLWHTPAQVSSAADPVACEARPWFPTLGPQGLSFQSAFDTELVSKRTQFALWRLATKKSKYWTVTFRRWSPRNNHSTYIVYSTQFSISMSKMTSITQLTVACLIKMPASWRLIFEVYSRGLRSSSSSHLSTSICI
jgi:hypothetical protein